MKVTASNITKLPVGLHAAGFNTYLRVSTNGARSWVFVWRDQNDRVVKIIKGKQYTVGRQREHGIGSATGYGSAAVLTLEQAVGKSLELKRRMALDPSFNPILAREEAVKAAVRSSVMFADFLDDVIARRAKEEGWKGGITGSRASEFKGQIKRHAASIYVKRLADVSEENIIATLKPIWHEKAETGRRLRQFLDIVFAQAVKQKLHKGPNPAALELVNDALGKQGKLTRDERAAKAHKSLSIARAKEVLKELLGMTSLKAMATALTFLTVTRASETAGARWTEINWKHGAWIIPGSRMKESNSHIVTLSSTSLLILKRLHNLTGGGEFIFASARSQSGHIDSGDMVKLLRSLGVSKEEGDIHGLRGTFAKTCRNIGANAEARELSLSHAVGNIVTDVYAHSPMFVERKELSQNYDDILMGVVAAPEEFHFDLAA